MPILTFAGAIVAWLLKNVALIVGILESILKLITGIVSITPTKQDDKLIPIVDKIASEIKKWLYFFSEKLAGKTPNVPN